MKLCFVLFVLFGAVLVSQARKHFLADPEPRSTLAAPTPTPAAPELRSTLSAPTPTPAPSGSSGFSFGSIAKLMEEFMEKVFNFGKSEALKMGSAPTPAPKN
ncbi:uncharacterized protein CELE_F42A6.2 [Caenorhabditis elegans]|uniref:Uncharacterized protein n=1 Tax=Caenorhabditis elegans TaxID=6239 RepID=O44489_CAEEL|nr:Uncharacterized protein CELE_F42A6.2 [Caenorhabditis elegans]CCD71139.1 Uncharacterized protein CELE_F42A6.2 [Caenorhabditis elegans]|eukprot:NP_500328.2 Uncharacterized protein CELE_F42A6.2 [Caenorhabditis elegans]